MGQRLIDANALMEQIAVQGQDIDTHDVIDIINAEPTVDAVPVVRCKDCKHCEVFKNGVNCWCNEHGRIEDVDYFCADGEMRSE